MYLKLDRQYPIYFKYVQEYQIMLLNLLLKHCAKQEIFRKLIDLDALISILSVLLETPGSTIRLLSLLCISYFMDATSPNASLLQHFHLLGDDLIVLKLHIERNLISALDGLHLLKSASYIHENLDALKQYGVPEFVSQFLDSSEEESAVAAELITTLFSDSCPSDGFLAINEKVEKASTILQLGSLSSVVEIHSSLQSVIRTLESDMKKCLQELSQKNLETITKQLCLYIKLHTQGKS